MKKFLTMTALLVSGLLLAGETADNAEKATQEVNAAPAQQVQPERRRAGGSQQIRENMIRRMRADAATLLKRYDADGDGKLSEDEKAALAKDMQLVEELFPLSVSYKRLKLIDKDGDLQISDEEAANIDMEAFRENMLRGRPGMNQERGNRPGRTQNRERGARRPQPKKVEKAD